MIPEQVIVVMTAKDVGKTRGRTEPRMGESCGRTKSTAEYMNLELKGEAKSGYVNKVSSIYKSI